MGIGVDAKVSLEFHRLREQFPHWFRSQMGNKVWYTTVGAKDILGHAIGASSAGLSSKLKVILTLKDVIDHAICLLVYLARGSVRKMCSCEHHAQCKCICWCLP